MSLKVKKNHKVLTGGRTFKAGEIIPALEDQEEQRLINLGVCEWAPDLEPEGIRIPASDQSGNDDPTGASNQLPLSGIVGVVLTVEQFAELPAQEQKDRLKALEINPADRKEDRVAQYEDWYAQQLPAGDLDVKL